MNAIDTNVLIYAIDDSQPIKGRRAGALLSDLSNQPTPTLLPWQVLCEFTAFLAKYRRRPSIPEQSVEFAAIVREFQLRFPLALPSAAVPDLAIDIHLKDQVSIWDAWLLAACVDAGVTTLYTEDMQSRPSIRGVRLVNPFNG